MYGTMDITQAFATIDALSNNCNGVFGTDPRALTQNLIKQAILYRRFSNDSDERNTLASHYGVPFFKGVAEDNYWPTHDEVSINNLINYVGAHAGELSFLGGKLPLKMKLYHNRRLIGLIGIAAVVCVGCLAVYKKYYPTKEKESEEENEDQENSNDPIASDATETPAR